MIKSIVGYQRRRAGDEHLVVVRQEACFSVYHRFAQSVGFCRDDRDAERTCLEGAHRQSLEAGAHQHDARMRKKAIWIFPIAHKAYMRGYSEIFRIFAKDAFHAAGADDAEPCVRTEPQNAGENPKQACGILLRLESSEINGVEGRRAAVFPRHPSEGGSIDNIGQIFAFVR